MPHQFDPAKMDRLLAPDRAEWLSPDLVLSQLELHPGLKALDFGCGPGFFTLQLGLAVFPQGAVVAADIEPAMLERLTERARAAGQTNVSPLLCDLTLPLRDGSIDRVLVSLVLHELEDRTFVLHELGRVLRPSGLLLAIEWHPWQTERGPGISERLTPAVIQHDLTAAGLVPTADISLSAETFAQVARKP